MKKTLRTALLTLCIAALCAGVWFLSEAASADTAANVQTKHALIFGDGHVIKNDYAGMLYRLFENEGIELKVTAAFFSNYTRPMEGKDVSSYNLYELFKGNTSTAVGTERKKINDDGTVNANGTRFWNAIENENQPIDYFIYRCPTEMIGKNSTYSSHMKQLSAFNAVLDSFIEYGHENVKIILLVPHALEKELNGYWFNSTSSSPGAEREDHATYISRMVDTFEKAAKDKNIALKTVCFDDAMSAFYEENPGYADMSLIDSTGYFHTQEGTYLDALLTFSAATGKTAYGMQDYCLVQDDIAIALQRAAHFEVFDALPDVADLRGRDERIDEDLFPDYSSYSEDLKPLLAAAKAYYDRGDMFQYEQWSLDRRTKTYRRHELAASPEMATPQFFTYLDCASFIPSILYDVYNYKLPSADVKEMMRLDGCVSVHEWNWVGPNYTPTDGESISGAETYSAATAAQQLKAKLNVGDVIAYRYVSGYGHTMLYIGDNKVVHSTGVRYIGNNSDYDYVLGIDRMEVNGTIRIDSLDIFTEEDGSRYMFIDDARVTILNPIEKLNLANQITDRARTRLANLQDIVFYKLSTEAYGQSVYRGETVTFTFVIKNVGNASKTVSVTDVVPANTSFVRASGLTLSGSSLSASVTVAPGETKQVSYTVQVNFDAPLGQFVVCDGGKVGGVSTNETHFYVHNTLTSVQEAKIAEASETATGTGALSYVKNVYKAATGTDVFDLYISADEIFKYVFEQYSEKITAFRLKTSSSGAKSYLVPGLIGGQNYVTMVGYDFSDPSSKNERYKPLAAWQNPAQDACLRIEWVNEGMLMVGDIILVETTPALDDVTDTASAPVADPNNVNTEMWIYCGNGVLRGYKNAAVQTLKGTDTRDFLNALYIKRAWCVLRPSHRVSEFGENPGLKIWAFGDHNLGSYYMATTFSEMVEELNAPVTMVAQYCGHSSAAPTYNAYELFVNNDPANGLKASVAEKLAAGQDIVIIQTGRDLSLTSSALRRKNIDAVFGIAEAALAGNPKAKIVIVAPYSHRAFFSSAMVSAGVGSVAEATEAINAEALEAASLIRDSFPNAEVKFLSLASLFESYGNMDALYRASDNTTTLANEGNRANNKGSYLAACALYYTVFGDPGKTIAATGHGATTGNVGTAAALELQQEALDYVAGRSLKIWAFGGHTLGSYGMLNTFKGILNENNAGADTVTGSYLGHTSTAGTWNAYELFEGSDPNNAIKSGVAEKLAEGQDVVILQTGRDYTLGDAALGEKNVLALCKLAQAAIAANPDVKILLLAPYGHQATYSAGLSAAGIENHAAHVSAINAEAESAKTAILAACPTAKVQVLSLGSLFETYDNASEIRSDLFREADTATGSGNVGNRASARGSYLAATAMYYALFDNFGQNFSYTGYNSSALSAGVTALEAQAMQNLARELVANN